MIECLLDTAYVEDGCNPPCENGGICDLTGKFCVCPETFDGAQCERRIVKETCPLIPHSHTSRSDCSGNTCSITCIDGHALDDGSTEVEMICQNHKWIIAHSGLSHKPVCKCKIGLYIFIIFYFAER